MVKEVLGSGEHFRDGIDSLGIKKDDFRRIMFQHGHPDHEREEESQVLEKLAQLPDFNDVSFRLINYSNTDGTPVNVILVPKWCPKLRADRYEPTDDLPPANECYVVNTWSSVNPDLRKTFVLLVKGFAGAVKISKRLAQCKWACSLRFIEVEAKLVPPEDWKETAKYLIDNGQDLPESVLRWGGLKAYAQRRMQERLFILPSTVVR